jgi:hypothetical protein
VKEYGFVGINLNPDPSGGWWTSLPLADDLREDDRIRHPGDGACLDELQSRLRRSSPVQRRDKK